MNVIAKICCYLERGVVTLKSRKEYLNSVTHTTSALLRIKNWTVWYIERYSMSTYTGVTNCQKTVRFFGPPCRKVRTAIVRGLLAESVWILFLYLIILSLFLTRKVFGDTKPTYLSKLSMLFKLQRLANIRSSSAVLMLARPFKTFLFK